MRKTFNPAFFFEVSSSLRPSLERVVHVLVRTRKRWFLLLVFKFDGGLPLPVFFSRFFSWFSLSTNFGFADADR